MSQPRSISAKSTSPSKSAFRRPSSRQTPTARTLLPSPHFENDPVPTIAHSPSSQEYTEPHTVEEEGPDDVHDVSGAFQPFFTLIQDSLANEHFHPTVHYIFADDDADIITEAACRSLEHLDHSQRPSAPRDSSAQPVTLQADQDREESRLPQRQPGVQEHYLILDIQPTEPVLDSQQNPTLKVVKAHSLSSDWQIIQTSVTKAPTIGEEAEDDSLMLRIEGRGNTPPENERDDQKDKESLEELVDKFQRRLKDIRLLMDMSEGEADNNPELVGQFCP